jgi:hypothetical protein
MKSFTICTSRQILAWLKWDGVCLEYSMHGGEQNCIQSFRKQTPLKTYFPLSSLREIQKEVCVAHTWNFRCVITFLCIGLMHHALRPQSLMNTGTVGNRILKKYIHKNLTVSQTFCISSFRDNYHVTNTLTNTFLRLAAALIRKEICQ